MYIIIRTFHCKLVVVVQVVLGFLAGQREKSTWDRAMTRPVTLAWVWYKV